MKKLMLLATVAFLITGVSFAETGKKKKKGKHSCCTKSGKTCTKDKSKTANL